MIGTSNGEWTVGEPKLNASSLDLRPLYYFVHVAGSGSFTRAAAALSVGQPIISRAIRGLEQDLQVVLLHRHGRGVSPTPAGEQLLAHGRTILRQLAETRDGVAALGDVAAGVVDIAMPPLFGDLVAIDFLKRMRADYPLISVHIREGYAADSLDWLSAGVSDIALVFNAPSITTLLVEHVLDDEIHIVGLPGSLESIRTGLPARMLAGMPLLLPPAPHRLRALVEDAARAAGIVLRVEAEISGVATLLELVKAGVGYTALPATLLRGQIKEGRLQSCPIVDPTVGPRLALVTSMQRPPTLAKKVALEALSDVLSLHGGPQRGKATRSGTKHGKPKHRSSATAARG
ncbi:MAG: LysR family transcriptional regulator [Rhodoplanes sp.]|uniref:LysR family transcriptional regulator n=1 Tax=Rhodoplanes sp. TaxID=1968906 RepID=UPI0017EDFCCC|nr:LysR family transcriptional regulator [Rhodoplanes sp.]NVO15725.1 LysR family transcriptional regulator [Rhodoplanes sp.]